MIYANKKDVKMDANMNASNLSVALGEIYKNQNKSVAGVSDVPDEINRLKVSLEQGIVAFMASHIKSQSDLEDISSQLSALNETMNNVRDHLNSMAVDVQNYMEHVG